MKIEKTGDINPDKNLVMIIYGKGGVGKTTFAASAPRPLLLGFENGDKFLGQRGINVDVMRFSRWLTNEDKADLVDALADHDTIALDPLGEAMDLLIESSDIKGKKFRDTLGGLTIAGWGEVKKQMKNFIKFLRSTGKNIIIVSHVNEIAGDEGLKHRIQVATKLSNEIPNMVDIISYLDVNKEGDGFSRMLYTPAQGGSFDSKDRTGRLPLTIQVSELNGFQDMLNAMKPLEIVMEEKDVDKKAD